MSVDDRVLVVAAHPDDEALGCGGTIARYVSSGADVRLAFLADGVTSRDNDSSALTELENRRKAANDAARILGVQAPIFFDFADQRLDQYPFIEIVKAIEGLAKDFEPTVVYTHYYRDLNVDHRTVAKATLTAFRPLPKQTVRSLYGFEVLSSTEWEVSTDRAFRPLRFVDISGDHIAKKLAALTAYEHEMREFPHARSLRAIEALAQLRGASVGLSAAEGFVVYREVIG